MKTHRHLLFTCAICALLTAPAMAQSTSGTASPSAPSSGTRPEGTTSPSTIDKPGGAQQGIRSDSPTQRDTTMKGTGTQRDGAMPGRTSQPGSMSGGMSDHKGMPGQKSADMAGGQKLSSSQVRRIQEALKTQGHDPGPIDGVMGAKTQDAIRAYQQSQNLSATGQVDSQTMEKLGLGRTSSRQ